MPPALVPVLPDVDIVPPSADQVGRLLADRPPGSAAYAALIPPGDGSEWHAHIANVLAAVVPDAASLIETYDAPTAGAPTVIALPTGPLACLILVVADAAAPGRVRLAAASAARLAVGERAGDAVRLLVLDAGALDQEAVDAAALVEGALLGSAKPVRWSADGPRVESDPMALALIGEHDPVAVVRGREAVRATATARAYANAPSNIKNPGWLADEARAIARLSGLRVKVWDEVALARAGFGGLIAVGQGSRTPPRLVQLTYTPAGATGRPVVLVGKGITFDTGGTNVKPAAAMTMMKTDMSGAAIVLSVLASCRALGIRRPVIGLMALAENAIGGGAYRPSDVITAYGGTTVEIGNTDAEGRIVLADALAYAAAKLDPAAVIDIATLTGAARIALGSGLAASYGSDAGLHARVRAAFADAGEPLWEMPLIEDYRPALDSAVADLSHIGPLGGGPGAGSIIAALFLREFTAGLPWVHLDIAGTGRSETDTGILAKGATGYGARGLLRWLDEE